MITINEITTNRFSLNGIEYFKNFTPVVRGDYITIVNTYDARIVLSQPTIYSDFTIDGNTYADVELTQSALLDVVFTRSTLGSGVTGVWGSITGNIENQTDLIAYLEANYGGSIDQDNIPIVKGFEAASSAFLDLVAGIDALPTYTVTEKQIVFFQTSILDPNDVLNTAIITLAMRDKGKGTYGVGGDSLLGNLWIVGTRRLAYGDAEIQPNTQIINLGSHTSTTVEAVFNAQAEFTVQAKTDGLRLVNITLDAVEKQYFFTGVGGDYGTGGDLTATADQFDEITGEEPTIPVSNTASTDTGTELSLANVLGTYSNMETADTNTEYTFNDATKVLGGIHFKKINCTSLPTVTGAVRIFKGDAFQANTDTYLVVKYNGNRVEYWYESITADLSQYAELPFGSILSESSTPSTDFYASPCILKTTTGRYIYSHDIFGSGDDLKKTRIYYNDDINNNNWSLATTFTDFIWGTLFEYNDDIYIIGCTDYPTGGVVKISKSTDNGEAWSTPVEILGIPVTYDGWHTSAINGIIKDGYFVKAMELRKDGTDPDFAKFHHAVLIFGDLTDLTDSANWSYSNIVDFDTTAFENSLIYENVNSTKYPEGSSVSKGFLEGGLVEKSDGDLINILRLEQTPNSNHAVYLDVTWDSGTPTDSTLSATNNFINMPGGNVKFQVLWDSVSSKHWSVVNYNRYKYYSDGRIEAYLISSSDNCVTWDIHKKVLGYDVGVDWETEINQLGVQYSHFIIEDNNLLIVDRTANADADDWHNANLITLTSVLGFRNLPETSYKDGSLVIDENSERIEDANGIAVISDQSIYQNSPYMLTANNANKVSWNNGLDFTGSEFMRVPYERTLRPTNGFTVLAVIENLQSLVGLRILSLATASNDIGVSDFSFSVNGLTIGACYQSGFSDVSTSNSYILSSSYDADNQELFHYNNGSNRGEPATLVGGSWNTDHIDVTAAYVDGNYNELYIGKRNQGSSLNFTSLIKALLIIPSYKTPSEMATLQAAYNTRYSIY